MNGVQVKARCAIYTRKSSEEGLDQSFNSLDAQREACEAYILSQKHEGWHVVSTSYDDGGFSGGNMEQPGLKKLLADISAKRVDTVVVYKVDRLTRSLADFAKIVETFDGHGVSFVSVTQQFNTTTSMGRLTLNVLLSFAQFEREVTGERIRDKVAASKKKGMWMGGRVPLGYDLVDRRLIINREEAGRVRLIYKKYLQLGSVFDLRDYLVKKGIRSKARTTPSGQTKGGEAFSRGALYHLLNNPLYCGKVQHKGKLHDGLHEAIIDSDLWHRVAESLKTNGVKRSSAKNVASHSLLAGLLFDSDGNRFSPTHSMKRGQRYRYYTSQVVHHRKGLPGIYRLPALEVENTVNSRIRTMLLSPVYLAQAFPKLNVREKRVLIAAAQHKAELLAELDLPECKQILDGLIRRVVIDENMLRITVDGIKLLIELLGQAPLDESKPKVTGTGCPEIVLTSAIQIVRRGSEVRLTLQSGETANPRPIAALLKTVARARDWADQVASGQFLALEDVVAASGLASHYARKILRCAALSPACIEEILIGRQPTAQTVVALTSNLSLDWKEQGTNS